jgi:catenin alpha
MQNAIKSSHFPDEETILAFKLISLSCFTGEVMGLDSKTFANDPHSNEKRNDMIKTARALLSAITRLLCIADMADVYRLLASLKLVSRCFTSLGSRAT